MLSVFSVILEYRMDGKHSSDRPTVGHAFCTLAISKQTQARSFLFSRTIPVAAYNRAHI